MGRYIKVMMAILVLLTGILVLLPWGYASAGGIVLNQGFEQGEDGSPYGWVLTGNAMRVNTEPIHAGSWAGLISRDGGALTQWIEDIHPMATYDVWGWVYVSGNVTGVLAVDFWEGKEGRQLSSTRMLLTGDTNGTYVQKEDTLQAPPGASYLRISLSGTGWNGEGEVRFDEIGVWPPGGNFWDRLRESCFVATAAYGTETAEELGILRDFRDQVLLHNGLGSQLVATYYRLSPPLARFIANNDFLRAVVREALVDPVVSLLQLSQHLWRT
ncbi:MAG: CFI-box-CTERM domain-containing protein [Dehalococcoidia bacterium]